ncbi:ribosomal RNA-processing protein 17, partial [Lecanoromycetidae sp. Uapishka_2]
MFARPRSTGLVAPPKKRRKVVPAIEEISFDTSAREDYLTGFHKRKVQRIKHAKEEAAKKNREEKLAARKTLREGRKADLEKHVEAVNIMLRQQHTDDSDSSDEGNTMETQHWDGIAEDVVIDHEDEYVDEDRFTTVTVEAVDVSRNGLHKAVIDDEENEASDTDKADKKQSKDPASQRQRVSQHAKRVWTKEPPNGPKKRKKKFHYESKAERKVTRYKEKAGNRKEAKARKG